MNIQQEYSELFNLSDTIYDVAKDVLSNLNEQEIKLFDVTAHKRIFLFILTRALKSYASINILCRQGYGQDVSPLLRSLLENLITAHYITHDPDSANDKTARFVAYKWVIFKRHLAEEELQLDPNNFEEQEKFENKKNMILKRISEFKKNFAIKSDRALLNWSGKTVRDMARAVNPRLLEEYETTFRLCSRFAHPTILGDNEYIIQDGKKLTFSPLPSPIGVIAHMEKAIIYAMDFLKLTVQLFDITDDSIKNLKAEGDRIFSMAKYTKNTDNNTEPTSSPKTAHIRDSVVYFKI